MLNTLSRRCLVSAGAASLFVRPGFAAPPPLSTRFGALYSQAAKEGEVVYYANARTEEARGLSAFWQANFPQVRLTVLARNAPEIVTQVEAEKSAGLIRADVVSISEPYVAEQWRRAGMFAPYKVAAAAQLGDYGLPDGSYYMTGVYLLPPAFNTAVFPGGAGLPHSMPDFLNPAWKSKLVLGDPRTSGNTLTFFQGFLQCGAIDWAWIDALGKQDVLFVTGNPEAARMIAAGERPLSPVVSTLNSLTAKQKGQAINYFTLREGTVVAERPSGVMAGARHPNAARLLMEVLTSAEGQQAIAGAGLFWPTNSACPSVDGLPVLADFKPIHVDLASISSADKTAAFLARFDQAFGRS